MSLKTPSIILYPLLSPAFLYKQKTTHTRGKFLVSISLLSE